MKKEIISIFSGIDCLGLGFRNYFDIVLAVEKEKKACETLKANIGSFHPKLKIINKDITLIPDIEIQKYKNTFGLIGGPPCQAFSSARGKFDPEDERISMLDVYIKWIKIIEPQFFVFENVSGLLYKNKIHLYHNLLEQLSNLGYDINEQILNSHDYGNAQSRERVIVIGFRKDLKIKFEFPKPVKDKKYVKDIIVENEEVGECAKYDSKKMEIVPHIPEGGNWRNLKTEELLKKALLGNYEKREGGMTGVYKRLDRNKPCPTLTTSPTQRNTMRIHPIEDRPLSIKEYKRGQGIPDDYEIIGSTSQKYKFIGNGVPVELATQISKAIYETLINYNLIENK